MKTAYKILVGKSERDLGDLGIDGSVILTMI
jgi:hypothetical protein